ASGYNYVGVTATDPNNFTGSVTQFVYVAPVSVSVQTDPARAGRQMLVITSSAGYGASIVLGDAASNGVSLTFNGTALASVLPTNGSPFALVVAVGGAGNDILDARALSVSSVLEGGAGSDVLYGGTGRNLLIGGAGADTLNAGSAGDILIGGTTRYDGNATA